MLNALSFAYQVFIIVSVASVIISCVSVPQMESSPEVEVSATRAEKSCAKSIVTSKVELVVPVCEFTSEFDTLTVVSLKALCKERGLKGYSKLRKAELVSLLLSA